jgi:hypothetical protein
MIFGTENSIQLARFRAVALAEDTLLCKAKQQRSRWLQPTRKRMSRIVFEPKRCFVSDNVLSIASASRLFVSQLRKNGYDVKFREFSGGHHASRQVADQAMSRLITAFHQRR